MAMQVWSRSRLLNDPWVSEARGTYEHFRHVLRASATQPWSEQLCVSHAIQRRLASLALLKFSCAVCCFLCAGAVRKEVGRRLMNGSVGSRAAWYEFRRPVQIFGAVKCISSLDKAIAALR